jgi:hypothetical protein
MAIVGKSQCETSKSFRRGTASGNAPDLLLVSPDLMRANTAVLETSAGEA